MTLFTSEIYPTFNRRFFIPTTILKPTTMQMYEDALCVQFMARMLQFKKDHKCDCVALILTEEEFIFKMLNDVCPINGVYNFIDGSSVICYGNNQWVCSDYDKNEN